jgi:hypothetical protein
VYQEVIAERVGLPVGDAVEEHDDDGDDREDDDSTMLGVAR